MALIRLIRPGVVFVREFVPRAAVALLARLAFNEPYRVAPMRSRVPDALVGARGRLVYEWRTGDAWHRLAAAVETPSALPAPGSAAAFVTERRWGFTRQRDGSTLEYEVTHAPWRVSPAGAPELTADVGALYGPAFAAALAGPPAAALVAEGSPVTVFRPRRLPRSPA